MNKSDQDHQNRKEPPHSQARGSLGHHYPPNRNQSKHKTSNQTNKPQLHPNLNPPSSSASSSSGSHHTSQSANASEEHTTAKETQEQQIGPSEFTLITPNLNRDLDTRHTIADGQEEGNEYTSFTCSDIDSALERLLDFFNDFYFQEHSLNSDLGVSHPTHPLNRHNARQDRARADSSQKQQQQHQTGPAEEGDVSSEIPAEQEQEPGTPQLPLVSKYDVRRILIKQPTFTAQPSDATNLTTPQPSAWWLDVACPTSQDMQQLGRIFPLHPLTIEDILQQDTREKTETFHGLGYYLVCFRGLNPSNFNYQQPQDNRDPRKSSRNSKRQRPKLIGNHSYDTKTQTSSSEVPIESLNNCSETRRKTFTTKTDGRKDAKNDTKPIPPDQPSQQDLDNYHYSHTIHDSPRLDLSYKPPHPIFNSNITQNQSNPLNRPGLGVVNLYLVVFRDGIISFHFENVQKHIDHVKDRIQSLSSDTGHVSPHWIAYGLMDSIVDEFFPVLELIEGETDELEEYLLDPLGTKKSKNRPIKIIKERMKPKIMMNKYYNYKLKSMSMIDRSKMLNRITFNRRLVVSMARLIAQKFQTVHALKKRMIDDQLARSDHLHADPFADHQSREIGLYLSDLQDHILSLTQALTFYDTILSNAHLTYLGVLRVGLNSTKQEQDVMIIRLYLITLIVLPMNMLIGLHSMNIHIPANGDQENHRRADGSPAPYNVFFIILSACFLIGLLFVLFIWKVIIGRSQVKFNRSFPKLFYFI